MRNAIVGAVLIAAVSTLGDFVWAGLHLRHRVAYGLAHGALLFFCIGAYVGSLQKNALLGGLYGAGIGLAAAGSFYLLAPLTGYAVMFFVWAFVWIALAVLTGRTLRTPHRPPLARMSLMTRGVLAMIGSGVGFYSVSGIWRPFDPQGWDYAVHFLSWCVAYLPGFLALLHPGPGSHRS